MILITKTSLEVMTSTTQATASAYLMCREERRHLVNVVDNRVATVYDDSDGAHTAVEASSRL